MESKSYLGSLLFASTSFPPISSYLEICDDLEEAQSRTYGIWNVTTLLNVLVDEKIQLISLKQSNRSSLARRYDWNSLPV
jgi:hypothetical protein